MHRPFEAEPELFSCDQPMLVNSSSPFRYAPLVALVATFGCQNITPDADSNRDASGSIPGFSSLHLPPGLCMDASQEGASFFDNLQFVDGEPFIGVSLTNLQNGSLVLQSSRDSTWTIGPFALPEGLYVEGLFEEGDLSGDMYRSSNPGVFIKSLHNDYAGRLFAFDLSLGWGGNGVGNEPLHLSLTDSEDPEMDVPNRFNFEGDSLEFDASALRISHEERKVFGDISDTTNWAMEACKVRYEAGEL